MFSGDRPVCFYTFGALQLHVPVQLLGANGGISEGGNFAPPPSGKQRGWMRNGDKTQGNKAQAE